MHPWMRTLILIGVLSAIPGSDLVAADCLEYGTVRLTGRLVRQTYVGPPDYESVTKGDAPVVVWVLLLDRYICVVDPNPLAPREYNEREVQLVPEGDQALQYGQLVGERIIATGKLLHGGASHEKRLVLATRDLQKTGVLP